jgi:hypothetical protein
MLGPHGENDLTERASSALDRQSGDRLDKIAGEKGDAR